MSTRIVRTIGVVADDLTGAGDSIAPFAAAGWRVDLQLTAAAIDPLDSASRVVALTTGARAALDAEAAARTATAAAALARARVDRLVLKIDSTMRGSVAAQLRGGLDGWLPGAFAVLCPAYPEHGRTVDANTVRVDGALLETSASAADPVTPVRSSTIASLVPGSVHLQLPASGERDADGFARALGALAADLRGASPVLAVDATTTADLDFLAVVIGRLDARAVAVGSAGLTQALARGWAPPVPAARPPVRGDGGPARILVVVSSLHDVARGQVAALLREQAAALTPDRVVVVTAPATPVDGANAAGIADAMARTVAGHLARGAFTALVLVGGDGALATLRRLDATSVRVTGSLADGVPYGTVRGGTAEGLAVVTKSGGFGEPDALIDIVQALTTGAPEPHQKRTTS